MMHLTIDETHHLDPLLRVCIVDTSAIVDERPAEMQRLSDALACLHTEGILAYWQAPHPRLGVESILIGAESHSLIEQAQNRLINEMLFALSFDGAGTLYRATFDAPFEHEVRFVRQAPGAERFAIVRVRVEPSFTADRLQCLSYVEREQIALEFQCDALRGFQDTLFCAGYRGVPVVGVNVLLVGGVEHLVDSRPGNFYSAGRLAAGHMLEHGRLRYLEPE
ncbi:MAG: hypothetical protein HC893_02210 [Chloroflexaceae bacterium]|nr:hypothetical protein [Chloroflexaceae bacterium]NJL32872.1 hypothetical protein [Chloroflexaceae bacterium]NJO06993.1 hypothetical protein [Chloroflexaceae bacterium]